MSARYSSEASKGYARGEYPMNLFKQKVIIFIRQNRKMPKGKIIATGAEAVIIKNPSSVTKSRLKKGYRHLSLDEKLRKSRTNAEAKIIGKINSLVPAPKIIYKDEKSKEIEMEFIDGKKLSVHLDKLENYKAICTQIGKSLAKIHDAGIIHGDLTTSNLLLKDKKVYFIDFGLSFHSERIEDKAVDLHIIKEALQAKHPKINEVAFKEIIRGYEISKNFDRTIAQLEKVEKRGRYKQQY